MQSSSNELSGPVSIRVKCKQQKKKKKSMHIRYNHSLTDDGWEVMLSGWRKIDRVSIPA